MNEANAFFDTNVLLYLLSADAAKADRAEQTLLQGGIISVQVLNEFAAVASRKLKMPHAEIREILNTLRTLVTVVPLTVGTHEKALALAERYGFSFYDALILSAAILAECTTVYSEDLQDSQIIEARLTIRNPFAS